MTLTYGELFAGYDGLGMGVRSVLGGESRWFAEFDKAPSKILAHHYPGVPNLGDVTKVDWASVPKVDVITGGSPCQDLSHAGKRKGMTDGTRSNLWVEMREAIAVIRPRLVVWENVRGALSAEAASDVEREQGLLGVRRNGPALRAIGRVVGDLASLGYVGRYYGLRAADVGAAHGRFRVFLFATPGHAEGLGVQGLWPQGQQVAAAPTGAGLPRRSGDRAGGLTLLPTPAVNDMGAAYTPETWDAWTERMKASHGNGNGHGKSLAIEAQRLLPTPVSDNSRGLPQKGTDFQSLPNVAVALLPTPRAEERQQHNSRDEYVALSAVQDWREYEAAIRRWEHVIGRPAPAPTEPGAKGQPRLSPRFVEWLMGLPAGWVTDVPGITRNDMLKALGNGVVPAQCAAATRAFIHDTTTEAVA